MHQLAEHGTGRSQAEERRWHVPGVGQQWRDTDGVRRNVARVGDEFARVERGVAERGVEREFYPDVNDVAVVVLDVVVSGRGWSPAECRRFLIDVLTQQLLEERPGGP
jgi:hypothetical protein